MSFVCGRRGDGKKDTRTGFRFALSSLLFTAASSRATVGREPTSRPASSSTFKSSSDESSSVEKPYKWTFSSSGLSSSWDTSGSSSSECEGSKSDIGDSDGEDEGALHGPGGFRSRCVARLARLGVFAAVLRRVSFGVVTCGRSARFVSSPLTSFDFVLWVCSSDLVSLGLGPFDKDVGVASGSVRDCFVFDFETLLAFFKAVEDMANQQIIIFNL